MKIRFLGTAAAEGMPGPFCDCENCRKARVNGGKDVRTRSQALVDDELLIDFPADNLAHMYRFGLNYLTVRDVIITHVHEDHYYPADFMNLQPGFSHVDPSVGPFRVWGSPDVRETGEKELNARGASFTWLEGRLEIHELQPFTTYDIAGHKVTPLKATHGTAHPYIYVIQKGEEALMYAHDTGFFCQENWAWLKASGIRLGLVSMDCTDGDKEEMGYDAHMCTGRNRVLKRQLTEAGVADEKTVFVVNHFSHNGVHVVYDEMVEAVKDDGFLVSYDGREVEF